MASKIRDTLNNLFPTEIIKKLFDQLSEFRNTLRNEFGEDLVIGDIEGIEPIEKLVGVFTDGSNVIAERRGAGLAVFSATALVYSMDGDSLNFVGRYRLTPDSLILLLVPRFYLGTRANTIMRGLEYLVSSRALDEKNVDIAVFDGSYSSTLLSAQWGIEHLYRDLRRTLSDNKQALFEICEAINRSVERIIDEVYSDDDPKRIATKFFVGYPKYITSVYYDVKEGMSIPAEAEIPLLNFITVFLENNFAFKALTRLFDKAKKGKFLVWINKEPESRVLTRKVKSKAFSVFTDVVILDYILKRGEFIIFKAIPEVKSDTMYIDEKVQNNATHALVPFIAKSIYDKFGKYSIVYVKYEDYTIQFSYPDELFSSDEQVLKIIKTFEKISPNGYPVPLQHAHMSTTIHTDIAEIIADSILNSAEGDYREILKLLIGLTGRRLAGI